MNIHCSVVGITVWCSRIVRKPQLCFNSLEWFKIMSPHFKWIGIGGWMWARRVKGKCEKITGVWNSIVDIHEPVNRLSCQSRATHRQWGMRLRRWWQWSAGDKHGLAVEAHVRRVQASDLEKVKLPGVGASSVWSPLLTPCADLTRSAWQPCVEWMRADGAVCGRVMRSSLCFRHTALGAAWEMNAKRLKLEWSGPRWWERMNAWMRWWRPNGFETLGRLNRRTLVIRSQWEEKQSWGARTPHVIDKKTKKGSD